MNVRWIEGRGCARPSFFVPTLRRLLPAAWCLLALALGCRSPDARDGAADAPADTDRSWFVDRTETSGLSFVHFNGMTGDFYYPEVMPPGVALLDYDNDDDLDVFVVQGRMLDDRPIAKALVPPRSPLSARLFRNDGSLRFTDVTEASRIDARGYGMGAAAGDYDNDGCVDLYVTNLGANQLLRNNCDGTFTDATKASGTADPGWTVSAAFVDVDRDGWLDLFVGQYLTYHVAANVKCYSLAGQPDYCPPDSYRARPSHLFRNNRDGTFTDVTASAGMAGEFGPALGVSTADFNRDGWMDIFVANDGAANQLWINQRNGTFRNTALLAGTAVSPDGFAKASMGVDAGDFDNDGDEDVVITELQGQGVDLFVNDGSAVFTETGARAGLRLKTIPFTGFGVAWFDVDNDGLLDLAMVNGAVTQSAEALAGTRPFTLEQRRQLFRNTGRGTFEEVADGAGAVFAIEEVGRGAAFGDVDNDGDTDIVVGNDGGPLRLLVNEAATGHHWLGLRLVTAGPKGPALRSTGPIESGRRGGPPGPAGSAPRARDALGARVTITRADGVTLWRRARADGSYASSNDPRIIVGLAGAGLPAKVQVVWPDGLIETWGDVPIDRYSVLTQGTGTAAVGSRE